MHIIGIVLFFCQSEGVMSIYMVARTCLHFAYDTRRSDLGQVRCGIKGNQEAVEMGSREGWEQTVDYIP